MQIFFYLWILQLWFERWKVFAGLDVLALCLSQKAVYVFKLRLDRKKSSRKLVLLSTRNLSSLSHHASHPQLFLIRDTLPASWSTSQPTPASAAHSLQIWPVALEPDFRPSCDGVLNPLFLASESLTQSATHYTHSPGPVLPSPLTPCSAGTRNNELLC